MEEGTNKNKKMMIVIISLLSALLIVIITIFIFFMSALKNYKSKNNCDKPKDTKMIKMSLISLSEPINTNLLIGPDGKERVISINLSVAVNNETKKSSKVIDLIKSSEPIIRDITIGLLREKTYNELRDADSNNIIKEEILNKLQEEFKTNLILKVYLSGLYMT